MAELVRGLLHSACQVLGGGYTNENGGCKRDATTVVSTAARESGFRMPLHYPRYSKRDYEGMEEWRLDLLLAQYGLCFHGPVHEKRAFAIGAFLWPDQY